MIKEFSRSAVLFCTIFMILSLSYRVCAMKENEKNKNDILGDFNKFAYQSDDEEEEHLVDITKIILTLEDKVRIIINAEDKTRQMVMACEAKVRARENDIERLENKVDLLHALLKEILKKDADQKKSINLDKKKKKKKKKKAKATSDAKLSEKKASPKLKSVEK